MTLRALILGIAFLPVPAFAADVDGKWVGSIALPTGDITLAYKFNAVDKTLTGSMVAPDGTETVISDGKIEGDQLSFGTIMFVGRPFRSLLPWNARQPTMLVIGPGVRSGVPEIF